MRGSSVTCTIDEGAGSSGALILPLCYSQFEVIDGKRENWFHVHFYQNAIPCLANLVPKLRDYRMGECAAES
jgi:hypothetical protein